MIRIKLPFHEHPLYPAPWVRSCNGCYREGGYTKDGYRCYECNWFIHKECAEPSNLVINHPSHPQHPLHFSIVEVNAKPQYCKLCEETLYDMFYHCSLCNFVVDTACAKNPSPDAIEYPKAHEHSLFLVKKHYNGTCYICETVHFSRFIYQCSQCQLEFHYECAHLPLEITHPCHPKHPVKYLTSEEHHFSDGKCCICEKKLGRRFYHCSICKFSMDVACVRDPPPLTILFVKAHEHQLSIMPRIISFNCDACGMKGDRCPYSCQQCYFMVHQTCVDLPEIINVNRHEHRLSRRSHLSHGSWECGVCHKNIDWSYGAYSCSICPNYAIHSRCAVRDDVWDKLELKGILEETQEIQPYKSMHGNLICHFSHEEHYLSLNEGNIISCGGSIRCAACVFPICSHEAFYKCVQCDFILHENCANLPRKKRHVFHNKQFTLIPGDMRQFICLACSNYSSGFRYSNETNDLCVKCGSLSGVIFHESHPCPLYFIHGNEKTCVGCGCWNDSAFACVDCDFALDFKCLGLPKTTKRWYDEHLLSLCCGNDKIGKGWCDICEKTIEEYWFYKCDTCYVAFHTKCVLGDFSFLMPGCVISYSGLLRFEVMQTSPGFLPRCYDCRSRSSVPFVLKVFYPKKNVFICSLWCLYQTTYSCEDLY